MSWTNINGINMPEFTKDDWEWKDYSYTPGSWGQGMGDSQGGWQDEQYTPGGWKLSQAARDRLTAGGWDMTNADNMSFNMQGGSSGLKGTVSPEWEGSYRYNQAGGGGDAGYETTFDKAATDAEYAAMKAQDPMSLLRNAMYKTGDKQGQAVQYKRVGDRLVPVDAGTHKWDTNIEERERNRTIGKTALAVASAGMSAPATMVGQAAQAAGFLNTMSGGKIPGLSEVGLAASLAGNVGSLGDVATNGISSLGDLYKAGSAGYGAFSKGSQLMDRFSGSNGPTANNSNRSTAPSGMARRSTAPGMATHQGGSMDNTELVESGERGQFNPQSALDLIFGGAGGGNTGLLDLYGAYRGNREARDEGFKLQNLYSDAQGRRQPHLDRLNQSYSDPESFFSSNQWKGLSDVYKNSIDRKAGASGRLANPTDREVLLNNYAMKELENYRTGLRDNARMLNPDAYINPFMRGSTREANASNPYFALGGRGSVGGPGMAGGAYGTLTKLAQAFGGFDKIPQYLKDMFNTGPGSNPNYGSPEGGFESDYPGDVGQGFDPNQDEWGNFETMPGWEGGDTGDFDYGDQGDWGGSEWEGDWVDSFGDWF